MEPKTFFSVSLRDNIFTLRSSIPKILKLYPNVTYFLICKDVDKSFFSKNLSHLGKVVILSEEYLISYNDFLIIYYEIIASKNLNNDIGRLGWYYQQTVKIIFALQSNQKFKIKFPIVMFDADSILLNKIQFFNNYKHSLLYGSLCECFSDYFKSLKILFGEINIPLAGYTTQFFSSTISEASYLRTLIKKKYAHKNENNIKYAISRMILDTSLTAHKTIIGSKFSEQELFGISNSLYSKNFKQILIFSYRSWVLKGFLSPLQIKLLKVLRVNLITYENRVTTKSKAISWKIFIFDFVRQIKPQVSKYFKITINQSMTTLLTYIKNFL